MKKKKAGIWIVLLLIVVAAIALIVYEPLRGPYIITYKSGSKTLKYIGEHWTFVALGGRTGKGFRLMQKTFTEYNPDLIILEGISNAKILPVTFIDKLKKSWGKDSTPIAPFTVIGGEPTDRYLWQQASQHGYSLEDILGFYLLRIMWQWKWEGKTQTEDQVAEYISWCLQEFGLKDFSFSYQQFKNWYQQKTQQNFDVLKLDAFDAAPVASNRFPYMRQLAYCINKLRDSHLDKVITQTINQYDKILIIYGSGHFPTIHQALEKINWRPTQVESSEYDDNLRASLKIMLGLPITVRSVKTVSIKIE